MKILNVKCRSFSFVYWIPHDDPKRAIFVDVYGTEFTRRTEEAFDVAYLVETSQVLIKFDCPKNYAFFKGLQPGGGTSTDLMEVGLWTPPNHDCFYVGYLVSPYLAMVRLDYFREAGFRPTEAFPELLALWDDSGFSFENALRCVD